MTILQAMEIDQLADEVDIVLYVGEVHRILVLCPNHPCENHCCPCACIKCIQLKMAIKIVKLESFSRVSWIDRIQHVHNIFLGSKADCEILATNVDDDKQEQTTPSTSSIFS